jgi:hypothetical protein
MCQRLNAEIANGEQRAKVITRFQQFPGSLQPTNETNDGCYRRASFSTSTTACITESPVVNTASITFSVFRFKQQEKQKRRKSAAIQ